MCCEQAGIVNNHAHSALGDTLATAELLQFYMSHHAHDVVPWSPLVAAAAASVVEDLFTLAAMPVTGHGTGTGSAPGWTRADAGAF